MSINNSIFCTAPFTTLRIESWSQDFGVIFKPGCVYNPSQSCDSLDEYLNGSDMEEHRNNLLNGTVPRTNCRQCSVPESQGMTSIRKQLLTKPWASDQKSIKLLDVLCGPEWSSYLSNERYKAGLIKDQIKYKTNIDIALDTIDKLPELISVSFIGGEFFLVDDNIKLLEKIKQRNLTATIITNATVINQNLVDILKEIADVEIRISIDGVGEGFEFIRYPAVWETWQSNVDYLRAQLPHADICCAAVFQMLNCQQIHEMYDWANRKRLRLDYQFLSSPSSLRFSVLDAVERESLIQTLQEKQAQKFFIAKPQRLTVDNLIAMIQEVEFDFGHRSQCIELISKLCVQRKITPEQIQQQFGVLSKLANEIVERVLFYNKKMYNISNETSNNCN